MTSKYWGDERETDAIYAVYLRKVRYRPTVNLPAHEPGICQANHNDNNGLCPDDYSRKNSVCSIEYYKRRFDALEFLPLSDKANFGTSPDHLQWETVKEKVLKAGTLNKLVKALLDEEFHVDSRHFNVFFATFRAFSEPHDVLRAILAEIYVILSEKEVEVEVIKAVETQTRSWYNILNWWIDLYPDDFRAHPYYNCLTHLIEFTRIQQGIFHDLFVKCVRRRDDFSRSLMKPFTAHFAIEKFVLSSPADNPNGYMHVNSVKIPSVVHTEATYVAEQLTYLDAEIFKRLIPHQCQSCFWSKRGNKTNKAENSKSHNVPRSDSQDMEVYTVKATIDQFNCISRRAMSTIVHKVDMKYEYRARIIDAWIDIAQELRFMKNFSSLKAVLSALQSEAVYRLKNTWSLISSDKVNDFNELSRLFSEEDNYNGARMLLEKEGTAKVVSQGSKESTANRNYYRKKQLKYRRVKSDVGEIQGTVPYLGTFLTDLTMIDTASADFVEDGLINFEKRRKEFDVLAQLKLFQAAARNYHLKPDPRFRSWFCSLPHLTEDQCYSLSCLIEPHSVQRHIMKEKKSNTWSRLLHFWDDEYRNVNKDKKKRPSDFLVNLNVKQSPNPFFQNEDSVNFPSANDDSPIDHFRRQRPYNIRVPNNDKSIRKTTYIDENSHFYDGKSHELETTVPNNVRRCMESKNLPNSNGDEYSFSKGDSGVSSPSTTTTSEHQLDATPTTPNGCFSNSRISADDSGYCAENSKNYKTEDGNSFVIRVGLDDNLQTDPYSTTMYKSIKVENNDKTHKLVERALHKHQISANPSDFIIVQILPFDEELLLPERGNAFYAVNRKIDLGFILRRKNQQKSSDLQSRSLSSKKKHLLKPAGGLMSRWSSGLL